MIRTLARLSSVVALAMVGCFGLGCDSREATATGLAARLSTGDAFVFEKLPLRSYNLFDLAVVDVDQDGWLDLFTVNHNARSSLLLNRKGGSLIESLDSYGLGHSTHFPGIEDSSTAPPTHDGVHVFFQNKRLSIRSRGVTADDSVSVRIWARCSFTEDSEPSSSFQLNYTGSTEGSNRQLLEVQIKGNGTLRLKPSLLGVRYKISVAGRLPKDGFRVGGDAVAPEARSIEFTLRDRHGAVWFDADRDGALDVFIGRGGLRGQIRSGKHNVQDELLARRAQGFQDIARQLGLTKGATRSRQIAAADLDGDGALDLVLGNNGPMKLLRRSGPNAWTDVTSAARLQASYSAFRIVDFDRDGDLDIIATSHDRIALETQESGVFRARLLHRNPGKIETLAVADFDRDGAIDVFAAGKTNVLLHGRPGDREELADLTRVGLPRASLTASWVDYDNDGWLDLFTVPQGLFRQRSDHTFEETGLLAIDSAVAARAAWFDVDNDGDRDLVLAIQPVRRNQQWLVGLVRNEISGGNGIGIDLQGPRNIAIGAEVTVLTSGGARLTRRVGESESSHFSQGHYRVYFGLGSETVTAIEVRWPDGVTERQQTQGPGKNRVFSVRRRSPLKG